MAIHNDDVAELDRAEVIGGDGGALGTVAGIYFDNATDRPDWVAVRGRLFGSDVALVPLAAAELRGGTLHVPFDAEQLRSAPRHDPGHALSPQDEIELFRHYGVSYDTWAATVDDDVSSTGTAEDAMTLSEEQLRVRTESKPIERVRLRKHIVTEYQTITVPVRREEIRLEREPAGAADAVGTGPAAGSASGPVDADVSAPVDVDDEKEIILYAERPVVRTETVAVERVRLGKRTVTDEETVTGEVRREEIAVDTDPDPDPDLRDPR